MLVHVQNQVSLGAGETVIRLDVDMGIHLSRLLCQCHTFVDRLENLQSTVEGGGPQHHRCWMGERCLGFDVVGHSLDLLLAACCFECNLDWEP